MIIRPAQVSDAAALGAVHLQTWLTSYRGIVPDSFLERLSPERSTARWQETLRQSSAEELPFTWVAANEADQVIGFAHCGAARSQLPPYTGEIYALYLLADHQRRGIGRALFEKAAQSLLQAGFENLFLWVLRDNPSRAFYEHLGGVYLTEQTIEIGAPLIEVAYGWPTLAQTFGG